MPSGVLQTGNYETRVELIDAIREHYEGGMRMVDIALRCDVSPRCVRRIIVQHDMVREVRPVVEPKPMSIRGHELRLVTEPCWREWCEGAECVFHQRAML